MAYVFAGDAEQAIFDEVKDTFTVKSDFGRDICITALSIEILAEKLGMKKC